jgi:hypothetical protein
MFPPLVCVLNVNRILGFAWFQFSALAGLFVALMTTKKDRTGVIDAIAEDKKTGEVVLVMNEPDDWDGSDEQLLALQERFNAYVSFLLDGEMAESHPELAGKAARIELRCAHMPDTRALELLGHIHDQLAFQEIRLEVVVRDVAG